MIKSGAYLLKLFAGVKNAVLAGLIRHLSWNSQTYWFLNPDTIFELLMKFLQCQRNLLTKPQSQFNLVKLDPVDRVIRVLRRDNYSTKESIWAVKSGTWPAPAVTWVPWKAYWTAFWAQYSYMQAFQDFYWDLFIINLFSILGSFKLYHIIE